MTGSSGHSRCVAVGVLLAALPLLPGGALSAQTSQWKLEAGTARFTADYTLGSFTGRTTAVRGQVSGTSVRSATGSVEVQLDSLSTGNGLRDKHMRDALETTAHPTARFATDSILLHVPSAPDSARIYGTFTVRGVARPVIALARVRSAVESSATPATPAAPATSASSAPRDVWVIDATFPVTLADHGIAKGISRFMGAVRVGPVVEVSISARFEPAERVRAERIP